MWGIFALFRIKWRNFTNIFYKYFCHTGCSAVLVIQLYIVTFVAHWAQCSLFSSHTHFHNQHTAQKKRVSMPRSRGAASVELSTRLTKFTIHGEGFSLIGPSRRSKCLLAVLQFRIYAICHLGNGQLSMKWGCLSTKITTNWWQFGYDLCGQASQ